MTEISMTFDWIDFPGGRARVAGTVRGGKDDGGHDTFEIQLGMHPGLYGELRPVWASNGNDFDIEILNFGYVDPRNVGNQHPDARRNFSALECEALEQMITNLLRRPEAQKDLLFFKAPARFIGGIRFARGWVVPSD
jgi:hypothetical protein